MAGEDESPSDETLSDWANYIREVRSAGGVEQCPADGRVEPPLWTSTTESELPESELSISTV